MISKVKGRKVTWSVWAVLAQSCTCVIRGRRGHTLSAKPGGDTSCYIWRWCMNQRQVRVNKNRMVACLWTNACKQKPNGGMSVDKCRHCSLERFVTSYWLRRSFWFRKSTWMSCSERCDSVFASCLRYRNKWVNGWAGLTPKMTNNNLFHRIIHT